jgi:hypothetical protein
MPSVDEDAVVELYATATNVLFPKVVEYQVGAEGIVRNVQVMPSVEEAAVVEPDTTATNVLTGLL